MVYKPSPKPDFDKPTHIKYDLIKPYMWGDEKTGKLSIFYSEDLFDNFTETEYSINKITTNVDPVFDKDLFYSLNDKYQKVIGSYYSPFKITKLLE